MLVNVCQGVYVFKEPQVFNDIQILYIWSMSFREITRVFVLKFGQTVHSRQTQVKFDDGQFPRVFVDIAAY